MKCSNFSSAMDNSVAQNTLEAFDYLSDRIPPLLKSPDIAVICGSGLGGLADIVQSHSQWEISYTQIPHFPHSQGELRRSEITLVVDLGILVKGHAGKLLFGLLPSQQNPIVLMLGRPQWVAIPGRL